MLRKFSYLVWTILFLCVGFSGAFAQNLPAERIFKSISPQEALRMINSREDIVFLDVRTPKERARGYIPGSQLVSFNDVVSGKFPIPTDKAVLLACAVGGRSYVAGQVLSRKGYREVYNLSGGISKWYKSGLPITHD